MSEPDVIHLATTLTDEQIAALPDELRAEVEETRALLDCIDRAWTAPAAMIDQVKQKFLVLLPEDHPWRRQQGKAEMMNQIDLDELERLARAATRGTWIDNPDRKKWVTTDDETVTDDDWRTNRDNDAAYVVAAQPKATLSLIEGIRELLTALLAASKEAETSKPTVVCLCGSTRFFTTFMRANYDETMAGRIVLSVGFYPHSQDEAHGEQVGCTAEQKEALDQLHMRKIDLADEILVLNVGGYIGDSTRREIAYAQAAGKRVRWLEPIE